jgi:hypothetical protein
MQLEFYTRFVKAHGKKVGLKAFEKLKSYYVCKLKEMNTCSCKYHVEMVKLRHGFNNMRGESKVVHGKQCSCNCEVCVSLVDGLCTSRLTTIFRG